MCLNVMLREYVSQPAGQPAEDRRPENASASRLRLQWASHAQPQLAMSDRPPSLEADREREWMGSQQSQEAGEEKRRVGQELSGEGQGEVAQHRKEQSARNGLSGGSGELACPVCVCVCWRGHSQLMQWARNYTRRRSYD